MLEVVGVLGVEEEGAEGLGDVDVDHCVAHVV